MKNVGKSYVTERAVGIFTDYIGKVFKDMLASDLANARYYCVLSDGSTDSAVIEQELMFCLCWRGHLNANFYHINLMKMQILKGLRDALIKHFSALE